MAEQTVFWVPTDGDTKIDLRYVVSIEYVVGEGLTRHTDWLGERLTKDEWSVFPTYEDHRKNNVLFWFEHSVPLDAIMLFKLTFGGQ